MAPGTVTGNAEYFFPVMAGPAGLSSLHRFHGDMVAVVLFYKEFRVTLITIGAMFYMAENYNANGFGLYVNFVHHPPNVSHTNSV
jgi:hypothetical protein